LSDQLTVNQIKWNDRERMWMAEPLEPVLLRYIWRCAALLRVSANPKQELQIDLES
jgi:hypothetical protein